MKNLKTPLQLALACAVVGALAAYGMFNSMMNFPVVFAMVCLILGGWSLWRERPREAIPVRAGVVLLGAALAVGGWLYQLREIEQRLDAGRDRALTSLQGEVMPHLMGLDPINTDRAGWDEAATLTAPATIVTFWARWCSPCEKEMPVLEELYREHAADGLRVLAVSRYDEPGDEEERRNDVEKALKFFEKRRLTYPAAMTDSDEIYKAYEVYSIPRTVLLDRQGRVVDYAISLESAEALMQRAVELVSAPA